MNEELGLVLKNTFLARKKQDIANDPNKAMLVPGERWDMAILFLDLSGFTAFSESLDHEAYITLPKTLWMNWFIQLNSIPAVLIRLKATG